MPLEIALPVRLLVRKMLVCTAALCVLAAPGAFAADVDSIVIRFTNARLDPALPAMPSSLQNELASTLGTFTVAGRSRDGGYILTLDNALDLEVARRALNVLRLDPGVAYATARTRAPAATPGVAAGTAGIAPSLSPPTNRLIVRFKDPAKQSAAAAGIPPARADLDRLGAAGGAAVAFRRYTHSGASVLQTLTPLPVAQMEAIARRIAAQPDVDYAQPDYRDQIALMPNDPCLPTVASGCNGGYQWDLVDPVAGINAPAAWNLTTGAPGIRIAVVDTGILFAHPDLTGRATSGFDFITDCATANDGASCTFAPLPYDRNNPPSPVGNDRDADAGDPGDWITSAENAPCIDTNPSSPTYNQSVSCRAPPPAIPSTPPPPYYDWFEGCALPDPSRNSDWHGTHVAGTIGAVANNGVGIAGINWTSPVVSVRALGKCGGFVSDISDAIVWAAGGSVPGVPANPNPARVVNLSVSGFRTGQNCDATYQDAISEAVVTRGAVVVASAGNSNYDAAYVQPANCAGVVAVTAIGQRAMKSYFANWGATIDIAAPGGDMRVNAITNQNGYGIVSTLNDGATVPNPAGYGYRQYHGTSMAAPHVSGVASLMLSVNPALTPSQVLAKLQLSARAFPAPGSACDTSNVPDAAGTPSVPDANWFACNCTTALCGAGLLDAYRAVSIAQPGGAATSVRLTSSDPQTVPGATVTITATITGVNPGGTVTFKDGANDICTAVPLSGTGDTKVATCTTTALSIGRHAIVAVYNGDGNNAVASITFPQRVGITSQRPFDVDGNVRDDLAWRSASGMTALWLMNGTLPASSAVLLADPNWTLTHSGDLNGDGRIDLIWRHTSGTTVAWLMNGTSYAAYAVLTSDPAWSVQRVADFDGNGTDDLLWRNATTGQTAIWLMNGLVPTLGAVILTSSPWTVTNVGDFDGDGKADLLWRNTQTGQTAIWLMDGVVPKAGAVVLADPNWAVTNVGNFDGNATIDLVWYNSVTKQTAIWLMSGLAASSGAVVLADPGWAVTHVGDVDGDGRDDLVWRNTLSGATAVWTMSGVTPTAGAVVLADPAWSVTHVRDLNGDGRADLVWRSGSGSTAAWLMSGLTYGSYAVLLTDPNWTVAPPDGR